MENKNPSCGACSGKGRLHPSETLAHDDENCLWCEDCSVCHGTGLLVSAPRLKAVAIAEEQEEEFESEEQAEEAQVEKYEEHEKQEAASMQELGANDLGNSDVLIKENLTDSTPGLPSETQPRQVPVSGTQNHLSLLQLSHMNAMLSKMQTPELQKRPSSALSQQSSILSSASTSRPSSPHVGPSRSGSSVFQAFGRNPASSGSLAKQNSAKPTNRYYHQLVSTTAEDVIFKFPADKLYDDITSILSDNKSRRISVVSKYPEFVSDHVLTMPGDRPKTKNLTITDKTELFLTEESAENQYSDEYLATMYRFELPAAQYFRIIQSFYKASHPLLVGQKAKSTAAINQKAASISKDLEKVQKQSQSELPGSPNALARRKKDQEDREKKEYFTKMIPVIKSRCIKLLVKWMKLYWNDFDQELIRMVEQWATLLGEDEDFYPDSVRIQESIRVNKLSTFISFYEIGEKQIKSQGASDASSVEECLAIIKGAYDQLFEKGTLENHLRMMEGYLVSHVKMEDVCKLFPSKVRQNEETLKSLDKLRVTTVKLIRVKQFLVTAILCQPNFKQRQKVLKEMFRAMIQLFRERKLTMTSCIVSTLLDRNILQQSIALSKLSSKYWNYLQEIIEYFDRQTDLSAIDGEDEFFQFVLTLKDSQSQPPEYEALKMIHNYTQSFPTNTCPLSTFISSIVDKENISPLSQPSEDLNTNLKEYLSKDLLIVSDENVLTQLANFVSGSDLYYNSLNYVALSNSSVLSTRSGTPVSESEIDQMESKRETQIKT